MVEVVEVVGQGVMPQDVVEVVVEGEVEQLHHRLVYYHLDLILEHEISRHPYASLQMRYQYRNLLHIHFRHRHYPLDYDHALCQLELVEVVVSALDW